MSRICQELDFIIHLDFADVDGIPDLQFNYFDFNGFGDLGRKALDAKFVKDDLEHATLSNAPGCADIIHGNVHFESDAALDAEEVHMKDVRSEGMHLDFPYQRLQLLLVVVDRNVDDRILDRNRVEETQCLSGVQC